MNDFICTDCWNPYKKIAKCKSCRKDICYKCMIVDRCKACYIDENQDDENKHKVQNNFVNNHCKSDDSELRFIQ